MPREDVQDELRPVNHPALGRLLQVSLLGGGQVVVEDQQPGLAGGGFLAQPFALASPQQCGRIGAITGHLEAALHFRARACRQFAQLIHPLARAAPVAPRQLHSHQQHPLLRAGFTQGSHPCSLFSFYAATERTSAPVSTS